MYLGPLWDGTETLMNFANYAAGVVVSKVGTATASIEEIYAYESNFDASAIPSYIDTITNKVVVFTNGCFDLLHPGHIHYLSEAKALGDVLIVGLNSDESVKKIKGAIGPLTIKNLDQKCF